MRHHSGNGHLDRRMSWIPVLGIVYLVLGGALILFQDAVHALFSGGGRKAQALEVPFELGAYVVGGMILYVLVRRIVRSRIRAEAALRKSEGLYRTLADASQDFIFIVDRDDVVLYANARAARSMGVDASALIGKRRGELFASADGDRQRRNLRLVMEGGEPIHLEGPTMFPGGRRWLDTWLIPFAEKDGSVDRVMGISRDITDRKRVEQALEESARVIRSLQANLPGAMVYQVVRKADGTRLFTYVGEGVRTLYGCSPEEALADPGLIYGRVFEEDRARLRVEEEAANGALAVMSTEVRVRDPSGNVRWSYFRSQPRRLEDGSTCWDGVQIDVTDRKREQEELKKSEANYRAIFDNVNDAIFIHDVETGTILDVNRKMTEMYGYTAEEMRGVSVGVVSARDPSFTQEEALRRIHAAAKEGPQLFEWKCRDRAGRLFWTEVSLKRADIGGNHRLLALVRDISKRKRAEEAVEELRRQLDLVLAATKVNIDIIDRDFNLRYVDPEWQKVYGPFQGRRCHDYFMGQQSMCEGCLIPEALRAGRMVVSEHVLPREGNRVIQVTTLPFEDASGEWLVAEVNVDITDRKRAEERLRESEEQLRRYSEDLEQMVAERTRELDAARADLFAQAKLSAMGRMGAGIAHQLNSPLGGAMLILDVLTEDLRGDARHTEMIGKAHKALEHMHDIVETMLSLAAVKRRGRAARQRVNLNTVVGRILDILMMEFNKVDVRVVQQLAPDLPALDANEGELDQIFLNLFNNAIDAMDGGGRLTITTAVARGGIEVKVADTGHGIPPEKLERIFEPFYTTRVNRRGVGLGLSIAREVADRYGGRIEVVSEVEKGTTFTVWLPPDGAPSESSESGTSGE